MSLLTPDSGLLFWMVIVFGIVFVILAKYGFPVITRMVDERKQYIDKSLLAAREANEQLANIKADSEMILAKAHEEQARILNEAVATRERILKEAKTQAQVEGQKLLDEAKKQIQAEKDSAISDIRRRVPVPDPLRLLPDHNFPHNCLHPFQYRYLKSVSSHCRFLHF